MPETRAVGQRVRRIDSPPKLTGQERFTGDLRVPGMLVARPVTSPYAHARIRSIDASRALEIPGVVRVLSADDLPIARDSSGAPVKAPIASGEAVYAGQFVALVLAESDAAAQDGVAAVEVDYEPLPVITTLDEALDPSSPHIRETRQQANDEEAGMHNADAAIQAEENDEFVAPNVSNSVNFTRGDVAAGFAAADDVVELHGRIADRAPGLPGTSGMPGGHRAARRPHGLHQHAGRVLLPHARRRDGQSSDATRQCGADAGRWRIRRKVRADRANGRRRRACRRPARLAALLANGRLPGRQSGAGLPDLRQAGRNARRVISPPSKRAWSSTPDRAEGRRCRSRRFCLGATTDSRTWRFAGTKS